ncbi:MAG TPA: M3 family metallopeptidase, partial [Jatrophihabitans sp.]|nr:M3 family metallopeptidase [Jatrophihabitans sp.]
MIPTSKVIPAWDELLLISTADLSNAREQVKGAVRAADLIAGRYRGRIGTLDDSQLADAFREYEGCIAVVQRLSALAEIIVSSGFAADAALATLSLCDQAWAALSARLSFFETELAEIDATAAAKLVPIMPGGVYANFYRQVVAAAATASSPQLSAALAALQPTGIDGWQALARQLFTRIEVAGAGEVASLGAVMPNLYLPDRELRQRSHAAITVALQAELELRATTLSMIAADGVARADLLGVSWMHDSLRSDQMTEAEVETLAAHAVEAYPLVHEYFSLKRELIGATELMDFDRYAPVTSDEPRVSWAEAMDLVLNTFDAVHPSFGDAARRLIATGHVDACPRRGKATGPFAKEMPGSSPYISVNFNGTLRNVLTLAHELGHGVHMEAARQLPPLAATTPRVLAETVALFFESVTLSSLLADRASADEQLSLSARSIEDRLVSICRHAALYDFERALRSEREDTEQLDADAVGGIWLATQREFYGSA